MKNSELIFIGLIIIVFFSMSHLTPVVGSNRLIFKVSPGDESTYTITKYKIDTTTVFSENVTLEDGSRGIFTFQMGTVFTVTVCNVTIYPDNSQIILSKTTVNGQTSICSSFLNYGYIIPVVENITLYQNYVDYNTTEYGLNGDIFTDNASNLNNGIQSVSLVSYNIKTGWLEKKLITESNNNGSFTTEFEIVRNMDSSIQLMHNFNVSGFGIYDLTAFFVTTILLFLVKRKTKY